MPLTPKNKFAKKKNYPKNKQNFNVLMWWMVITMFVWLKKSDRCKSRQKDKNLSHL